MANSKRAAGESANTTGLIDRLLTGEDGRPVNVAVEVVNYRPDTVIKHNLENTVDFEPIDFFMPLILLLCIFAVQMIDYLGVGLFIVIVLQVALVRDLFKRIRRRPSGRRAVGLVPPFTPGDWGRAIGIYLLMLPFALAAGWVNKQIYIALFPDSLYALLERAGANAAVAAVVAVGLFTILLLFFTSVIFAPVTEELWFRGIGLAGFIKTGGRLRAILWTSLIFGILHGPTRFLFSAVMGVAFAWIRFRTGSLHCAIALHAFHNFMVLIFMIYSLYSTMQIPPPGF